MTARRRTVALSSSARQDRREPGDVADGAEGGHRRLPHQGVGVVDGQHREPRHRTWLRRLSLAAGPRRHLDDRGVLVGQGRAAGRGARRREGGRPPRRPVPAPAPPGPGGRRRDRRPPRRRAVRGPRSRSPAPWDRRPRAALERWPCRPCGRRGPRRAPGPAPSPMAVRTSTRPADRSSQRLVEQRREHQHPDADHRRDRDPDDGQQRDEQHEGAQAQPPRSPVRLWLGGARRAAPASMPPRLT